MSADGAPAQDTVARPHVWRPGTGSPTLLMLHGTGADEHDLLPLGAGLAPDSPLLSPRGAILEGEMPRFFRRVSEGVLDEDDLRARTDELSRFLDAAALEYGFPAGSLVAVGFSNGANMATSLLIRHPEQLTGAIVIGAMPPYRDGAGAADLTGKRIAIVNGDDDPYATDTPRLATELRDAGATVQVFGHPGGHIVPEDQTRAAADFVLGR